MEETAPIWYILTGDRIRLDDKECEVLDINRAVNTIIRIAADNGVDPFQLDK